MQTYDTYTECKIAHSHGDVVKSPLGYHPSWSWWKEKPEYEAEFCNPEDYLFTVKEFLDKGLNFGYVDLVIDSSGNVTTLMHFLDENWVNGSLADIENWLVLKAKNLPLEDKRPHSEVEYNYSISKNTITIWKNDESRSVDKSYPKFSYLRSLILEEDKLEEAYELMDLPKFIETFTEGNITVNHKDKVMFYGDFKIEHSLVNVVMARLTQGQDVLPFIRFLDRLMENPKENVVEELYPFMKHNSIDIDSDGCILAYKGIRGDWKDCYTGNIDNSVGTTVKMPRTHVDDNPEETCSRGLHVASKEYASTYGDILVQVKVCPSNIVSVPNDYHGQKMRTCEYTVLSEVEK